MSRSHAWATMRPSLSLEVDVNVIASPTTGSVGVLVNEAEGRSRAAVAAKTAGPAPSRHIVRIGATQAARAIAPARRRGPVSHSWVVASIRPFASFASNSPCPACPAGSPKVGAIAGLCHSNVRPERDVPLKVAVAGDS